MLRLALHAEHLTDLSTDELASVAGGAITNGCLTGYYPTINAPCLTIVTDAIPSTN